MNSRFFDSSISKAIPFLFVLIFISIAAGAANAQTFTAKCIGVSDGDTITVLTSDRQQVKIRLHGIDCPEGGQAFGRKAKGFTSQLVFGKTVDVKPVTNDRYGRTVAHVFVDDKSVSHEIVAAGYG
jgi:endonuclease YncB( thermonuclease family)